MSTQTDVKAAHLSAAGTLFTGRTRLKGFVMTPAVSTAATVTIRDGSATASILYQMDLISSTYPNPFGMTFPGEGILAQTGLYFQTDSGSIAGITVFYG